MAERRYWNEVMETIDPERLWQLEDERLCRQLRWVWERSPFYRQKFSEAGIDPLTIGRDSLHQLPFTIKDEVRRTQQEYPPLGGHACVPLHEVVRIHASSGTTGQPTLVGLTEADARAWNEVLARFFWTTGVTRNSCLACGHPRLVHRRAELLRGTSRDPGYCLSVRHDGGHANLQCDPAGRGRLHGLEPHFRQLPHSCCPRAARD